MSLKKIYEKLKKMPLKGKSPDEVELDSYLAEEKRDNIKKVLGVYRQKKNQEMFTSNTLFEGGDGILAAKNTLTNQSPTIVGKSQKSKNQNLFFH